MPAGRKVNMVAGRGQASINFSSLGVGRHTKNVRRVIDRRVFTEKAGCCDEPPKVVESEPEPEPEPELELEPISEPINN